MAQVASTTAYDSASTGVQHRGDPAQCPTAVSEHHGEGARRLIWGGLSLGQRRDIEAVNDVVCHGGCFLSRSAGPGEAACVRG